MLLLTNQTSSLCNGTWWIYHVFDECILNSMQFVAFIFGLLSILCWLVAQIPQLIKNCLTGKADVALSWLFLLQWLGGDITNLIGAFLTEQLPTQIGTAVYFVCMDVVLLTQYMFYWFKNRKRNKKRESYEPLETSRKVYTFILPILFYCFLIFATTLFLLPYNTKKALNYKSRALYSFDDAQSKSLVVDVHNWKDTSGYILGWISAILYLCSRLPQILKNFKRKSVDGLSLPMFVMAVLGNLTYGLGILLYSVEKIFLLRKLPWLLGSLGTLCFDFTIFLQFVFYIYCSRFLFHHKSTTVANDNSEHRAFEESNLENSILVNFVQKDCKSLHLIS